MTSTPLDLATLRRAPKVALHDHLDGGVRAATVLEISNRIGHPLPADTAEGLADWFFDAADSGSLELYLSTFEHTVAVMQTVDDLARVAREFVEDMVADGVVYAETRWAPEQHLSEGLTLDAAVEAVQAGLDEGMAAARAAGTTMVARQLLTGMRHAASSREIAELAVRHRERGVAGFDIAGAEAGFPPSRHLDAFDLIKRSNGYVTIHAGEAFGLPSIWEAVQVCGANRLGHGVRLIDDITRTEAGEWELGELALYIRNQRIPLEVCPTSNLQTGAAASYAEHPIGILTALRFRVTVSCDNRLMSRTSLSEEFCHLSEAFGYDLDRIRWFTINAAKSAFWPFDERLALIDDVIKPGYAALQIAG
ncbi:adenosine deaminase [Mariniluteicoccus flavus]